MERWAILWQKNARDLLEDASAESTKVRCVRFGVYLSAIARQEEFDCFRTAQRESEIQLGVSRVNIRLIPLHRCARTGRSAGYPARAQYKKQVSVRL